jgi:hypothetical protein
LRIILKWILECAFDREQFQAVVNR